MKSIKRSDWPKNLYSLLVDGIDIKTESDIEKTIELAISYINNEKYRNIILYRYRDKMTLGEIAGIYGISKDRVRQLLNKIIKLLKRNESEIIIRYGIDNAKEYNDLHNKKVVNDINSLGLSTRAYNVLYKNNLLLISDVMGSDISEIAGIKGLGRKSFIEILNKMKDLGYDVPDERPLTLYNRYKNKENN